MPFKNYPAKILLFGEYTVLFGGEALAIPYPRYTGCWTIGVDKQPYDFSNLLAYLTHNNHRLIAKLDLPALKDLIESNYIFRSDIPQGIGLGSSGALSASIYDQFTKHNLLDLGEKKHDLAIIESLYHGKSSGFDALVSLQKKPIALSFKGLREIHGLAVYDCFLYLLYTGIQRHTQALVDRFNTACQSSSFKKKMELLASKSQVCIRNYVSAHDIFETVEEVSRIQYEFLDFLILPSLRELWLRGLDDRSYFLKICGAGGGGAYLLFSRTRIESSDLDGFRLEEIRL